MSSSRTLRSRIPRSRAKKALNPNPSKVSGNEALSTQTPQKSEALTRRAGNANFALSIGDIRRAGAKRVGDFTQKRRTDQIDPWGVETPKKTCVSHPEKLPEKFEMLGEFFNGLDTSIRLLRLRGLKPSFSNICPQIECLTDSFRTTLTASMATTTVSLKLLIDTKGHRVLFAEAGKDFVDFLFTLLSLPVGTVIRLLSKDNMVGSLGRLYDSVENLNDTYMLPNLNKDTLLKPTSPIGCANVPHLLTSDRSTVKKVYMCGSYHRYVADDPRAVCPQCRSAISTEVTYVAAPATAEGSSGGGAGFVKDVVTYMIMDNLEVKPMSTISCIAMLNKFNVTEVGALEEKVVHMGMDEGLKLLKASLESNNVLSNVFLCKKEE